MNPSKEMKELTAAAHKMDSLIFEKNG